MTHTHKIEPANIIKQFVFFLIHIGCLFVIYVGFSWTALALCAALYVVRMFAITGGYHRYFSHRSYQTSRPFQFFLGFLGASSAQKGPLWWASHHRHHHKHSDTEEDLHSPGINGLWWAHVGWILSSEYVHYNKELIKDFLKFPEIKWLDENHIVAPVTLSALIIGLGYYLQAYHPELHTGPAQLFVWGFCVSTTLLYHGTFVINSLTHMWGKRRFQTTDDSRNSFLLSLITLGEGWHNNHHRYPGSERQGMYWWEIDISHYILVLLSWFGIVWDIRTHPERLYEEAQKNQATA